MRRLALTLLAPLGAAMLLPAAAVAHPKLVSATPAADATVAKPIKLTLTFSEALVGPLSGIELTMTGMPGMSGHQPMPIKGFTSKADGKTLTVTLPRALPAGTYLLKWHAVAADQHRVEGSYSFAVK
ncbi:copper resistance protein C [Novosphingobium indicum]|uniref:Copper resistance protein C n=1 Tax=Novosphingobium indicum TaxID=462949 RepID=A0ABQ2K1Z7_9SPHN|nr:copper homeostasis periplasmic binding protein CopC [Novosphingobium indicum]GGN61619.1 copper resistance protein C [Novosphingobium indicum]